MRVRRARAKSRVCAGCEQRGNLRARFLLLLLCFAFEHCFEAGLGAVDTAQRPRHLHVHHLVSLGRWSSGECEHKKRGRCDGKGEGSVARTVGFVIAFLERLILSALSSIVAPLRSKAAATFASLPNSTKANLQSRGPGEEAGGACVGTGEGVGSTRARRLRPQAA